MKNEYLYGIVIINIILLWLFLQDNCEHYNYLLLYLLLF